MGCGVLQIARASTGIRVWFTVQNTDGSLRTGLVAGNFTVTIIRDDDAATNTPAVTESASLSGVYYFDVPTAFLTTNGNQYAMVVQVTLAPLDALLAPLFVTAEMWDQLAQPGDAMDLIAGAVDAAAIATDAIDADALAADAVTEIQSAILSDATPFAGANVDVAISTRSDFDETTDPVELLDAGGVAGTSAAELVVDIDAALSASHGAGSWLTSALSAGAVATAVWSEALPGAFGPGTAGLILGANLDVVLSTRAAPGDAMVLTVAERTAVATEVDAVLSAAHGGGSWVGTALTPTQDDRLRLIWKVLGLDPLQPTTHVTATIAVDGSISTPDTEIDITVDQVDANTATFTNA